jgi:A/G-specific adenine glycosylase
MKIKSLIEWSKKEFSHLPWRKNRSLYTTLISEIMLQQTTVSTVKNHFQRFLEIYPDISALSQSSEEKLLISWKGLGYYRRAKNLKKIADIIIHKYEGVFPESRDELLLISGIGPYTSSALISIGMDRRALAVDANIERVIARIYGIKLVKGPKLQSEIQRLFEQKKILNLRNVSYRDLNEALMDLGRTFCQARKVTCELCPLNSDCFAFQNKEPLLYPLESLKKKSEEHELELLRCFVENDNKILVYKKNEKEWLSGQYEVPTFIISSTDEKINQYPFLKKEISFKNLKVLRTGITKYKIQNYLLEISEKDLKKFEFTRDLVWKKKDSSQSNFSTSVIKGLKLISE